MFAENIFTFEVRQKKILEYVKLLSYRRRHPPNIAFVPPFLEIPSISQSKIKFSLDHTLGP